MEILKTLEISPSKESALIFSLKFLNIVDAEGRPTEEFANLRVDFSKTLTGLVSKSYSKLQNSIPLSLVSQSTLVNYFMQQGYARDTAEYQAKVFAWLCDQSDIDLPNIEDSFKRAHNR